MSAGAGCALVVLSVLVACSPATRTESVASSGAESRAVEGKQWYDAYCASCHGKSARGDGPVASRLRTPSTDLTTLAVRAGGDFDAPAVAAYIDGRILVPEHGPSDMPVWGRSFDDRNENLSDETRLYPGTIFQIVEYLRTLQVKE